MDLENLRALERVATLGSVLAASEAMRLSRGAVQRRIDNLESAVGMSLLVRGPRGTKLTPAGQIILNRGRELLTAADRMLAAARDIQENPAGIFRMVVPVGMPPDLRANMLDTFLRGFPQTRFHVTEAEDPISLIDSPFDIMTHFGPPPNRAGWFSRVLARMPMGLVATEAYLQEHGTPKSLSDLSAHKLMHWRVRGHSDPVLPLVSGEKLSLGFTLSSANLLFLRYQLSRQFGILLGPVSLPFGKDMDVEPVHIMEDVVGGMEVTVRVLTPMPSRVDPRTRAIVEASQRVLESFPTD